MSSNITYILVTGANSGLGFSICCRLIDEFLSTREPSSVLHLIPTTRSEAKATATVSRLRAHVGKQCRHAEQTTPGNAKGWEGRVEIEPELLDLCNILSIQKASKRLRQKYDKIDVMILNAGIGGWVGVDFVKATKQFFKDGIYFVSKPDFKIGSVGSVARPQFPNAEQKDDTDGHDKVGDARAEPQLGEVFCANVFGHYLLVHYLMSLLLRTPGQDASRVVWVSTLEAYANAFLIDDFQGMKTGVSYESSKRLTDVMAMTANSPSTNRYTASYFTPEARASNSLASSTALSEELTPRKASLRASTRARSSTPSTSRTSSPHLTQISSGTQVPPIMYTSHPGMIVTEIMPVSAFLVYAWIAVFYIARWLGSPWHNTWPYSGASCTTYLALAPKRQLDEFAGGDSTSIKWGSATNWRGEDRVKKTEVEWLYNDKGVGEGEEKKAEFLELGGQIWKKMEDLRLEWERRLRTAGLDEGLS